MKTKIKWPAPYPGAYWLDEQEDRAVLDVLHRRSLFRYYGVKPPRRVVGFEAAARRFYGVKFALGVNSGTGALMTAVNALGIGPGCEVIVPAFFWAATVTAVVQANAIPVLCEVDDSFSADPTDLARKITPRTRLIIVTHMAGAVADIKAIVQVARRHGIPVLEDCAQANGGRFQGRLVGTFGEVGLFSFQWNKNATAGEGGLLITNDAAVYERLNAVHDLGVPWGKDAPIEDSQMVTWGLGRRMGELTGAVAAVQLRKLPRITAHMRASKRRIKNMLADLPGLSFRRLNDEAGDTGPFLILLLRDGPTALRVADRLHEVGLSAASRLADYGLHIYSNVRQLTGKVPLSSAGNPWNLPENRKSRYDYRKGACPRSDALFERSILIPIPSRLTPEQEIAGAAAIRAALRG